MIPLEKLSRQRTLSSSLQGWHARLQRVPCCLGFRLHRLPTSEQRSFPALYEAVSLASITIRLRHRYLLDALTACCSLRTLSALGAAMSASGTSATFRRRSFSLNHSSASSQSGRSLSPQYDACQSRVSLAHQKSELVISRVADKRA